MNPVVISCLISVRELANRTGMERSGLAGSR